MLAKMVVGSDFASKLINNEVDTRIKYIKPVIAEKVAAAASGRPPKISGSTRLRRNAAEHMYQKGIDISSEGSGNPGTSKYSKIFFPSASSLGLPVTLMNPEIIHR